MGRRRALGIRGCAALSLALAGCGRIAPGTTTMHRQEIPVTTQEGQPAGSTSSPTSPVYQPVCNPEQYYDGNMIRTRCK